MIYRLPEINDKAMLQEYVQEHYENKEISISASLGLSSSEYSDWVEKMQRNASVGDEEWGKSLLYLCFDKSKLIGLLSIRYDLPEFLRKKYGDIGYGVRPSERNKGYATMMLQYALSVCRNKGMTLASNLAKYSAHVISFANVTINPARRSPAHMPTNCPTTIFSAVFIISLLDVCFLISMQRNANIFLRLLVISYSNLYA